MSNRNANFQDPVGLVLRMLASKNKAAYAALVREGLSLGAAPIDMLMNRSERRRLKVPQPSQHPLVLIIGAPRSGTTLIYQALTHYLDVTFPPNTSSILKRSPITAALVQKRCGGRTKPSFSNYYGQTSRLSDCNDAFDLWNRWLGEDRYYPATSLSGEQAADMRNFFDTWTNAFDKPFLNKNNRNTFAVELLAQHLPKAKFVVVRRNPVMVAQSLIVAREKIQGDKKNGWGLESSSTVGISDPLAHVDDVCRQITTIDDEMDRQLSTVDADRIVNITYEGFCESPQQTIRGVADAFEGVQVNSAADLGSLQPFEVSQQLTISTAEQQRIREKFGMSEFATSKADKVVGC